MGFGDAEAIAGQRKGASRKGGGAPPGYVAHVLHHRICTRAWGRGRTAGEVVVEGERLVVDVRGDGDPCGRAGGGLGRMSCGGIWQCVGMKGKSGGVGWNEQSGGWVCKRESRGRWAEKWTLWKGNLMHRRFERGEFRRGNAWGEGGLAHRGGACARCPAAWRGRGS